MEAKLAQVKLKQQRTNVKGNENKLYYVWSRVGGYSRLALTSKCYEPDRAHAKRIIATLYARTLF